MKFIKLNKDNYSKFCERMSAFDDIFTYPIGNDTFKISHGKRYFDFFERLGELRFTGFEKEDELTVVGASILRIVQGKKTWYLCDLKAHPDFRNQHLTTKLIYRNFIPQFLRARKCYAISMNKPGEENRTLRIVKNFKFNFFKSAGNIVLYSLSRKELENCLVLIEKYKGKIGSISLKGIKDIILQSNGKPMRLNHLVFNTEHELGSYDEVNDEDDVYMFCTQEGSDLQKELEKLKVLPSSSATIIHHGMENWDWEFINTSEI